jgi:hypothetical protein
MTTTLTLDDDIVALLEQLREERGLSFEAVLQVALKEGLLVLQKAAETRTPYRTPAVSLGRPHLPSLDNVGEVLASSEGEGSR